MHDDRRFMIRSLERTLRDLCQRGLDERMRCDQAAQVIIAAHRLAAGAAEGTLARPPRAIAAVRTVMDLAEAWDPATMTAYEYVEMLPPAVIDRLLAAAPQWAAACLRDEARLAA